jgi:2-keto-4-pentenoate hydratase
MMRRHGGDRADSAVGAADVILDAFASQRLIAPLSDGDPSLDEEGAYAIAWELHARRLRRGETPVGRKIGFTNRTIWAEYGVSAPIWGHVYDSTVLSAPAGEARIAVGHLLQPRIEPEIQLHFARTPPLTRDEGAILECIDWIAQGFEIVQSPFPDWQFRAVDTIAALALHGALVVGPPVAVVEIEDCVRKLRSFAITLSRNGVQQTTGGGANVLDSPLLAIAYLAEVLAQSPASRPFRPEKSSQRAH